MKILNSSDTTTAINCTFEKKNRKTLCAMGECIPLIFNAVDKEKADFIIHSDFAKLSDLCTNEMKDLAVVWSYYSGKIEGNAYAYVETEVLLKDRITSEKKYTDAVMLVNLYNTFTAEIERIQKMGNKRIDEGFLLDIHKSISVDLLSNEESGYLRTKAVCIRGTEYMPPKDISDIRMRLNQILSLQGEFDNPLEKAVFLHCNIAKLQPFIDGNKRTSRMLESIVMMNADIIPVYSVKDSDIQTYKKGLMNFYETGDYSMYKDYFLDKQINRIKGITPEAEKRFIEEKFRNNHCK